MKQERQCQLSTVKTLLSVAIIAIACWLNV